ncbi:MAG TPA: hypothetical protein VKM56_08640 [Verrucomicrobiae bacterium]|nr:hypothetical protein [Verrucomicrobiae bacterium]
MKTIKLFLLSLIALTSFGLTGCVSHTRERVVVEPPQLIGQSTSLRRRDGRVT